MDALFVNVLVQKCQGMTYAPLFHLMLSVYIQLVAVHDGNH